MSTLSFAWLLLFDDLDGHFDEACSERPLMLAARYDFPVAAFQVLLELSNPRLANADGATPLILAAWGTQPYSAELAPSFAT